MKNLTGVTVMCEPLPASATVVLKYKQDQQTAYTQIFTHTSTNSLGHSAINIESSGAQLPDFQEITFRIESTIGAVVTALRAKADITGKDIYD